MKEMISSLGAMLAENRIIDLKSTEKMEVLREMVEVLSQSESIKDSQALFDAVLAREKIMSTGIGIGIAVPHVKIPSVKRFVMAMGRKKEGVEFDALDGLPVKLVVMIAAPDGEQDKYLRILARVVAVFKNQSFLGKVLEAPSPTDVLSLFKDK